MNWWDEAVARSPRIRPALLKAFLLALVNSAALFCTTLLFAVVGENSGEDNSGGGPDSAAVAEGIRIENLYVMESVGKAPEARPLGCHFDRVGSLYGFGSGKATVGEGQDGLKGAEKVRGAMTARAKDHVLKGLVLVGRVDRVRFDTQGQENNETLAMERVDWFGRWWAPRELRGIEGLEAAVDGAARIAAGPLDPPSEEECPKEVALECDADERERHRSVEIFACWAPKLGLAQENGRRDGANGQGV